MMEGEVMCEAPERLGEYYVEEREEGFVAVGELEERWVGMMMR